MPTINTGENVFKGERTLILNVDIDGPLSKAEAPCCDYYVTAYSNAAQQAQKSADANASAVYSFLQTLSCFHPNFDTPSNPFVPYFQMEGKRGLVPTDLSPGDVEAVRELSKLTKDPALRARLFDVLWELTNDYKACGEAAGSYIEAAERLNVPAHWTFAGPLYQRGLYLAAKLGREKELFTNVCQSLQNVARATAVDTEQFRCCKFLELCVRFGCGNANELAGIAARHAQKQADQGNHYAARHYREVEADLHRLAKNSEAEKSARIAAAEESVAEAEKRIEGQGASYMAAAALLSKAIEALRRAGAAKERIDELRKKLNNWQQDSIGEFETFSTEVDISELIKGARAHVKSNSVREAILKLAFGQGLSDPKSIREDVLKTAKEAPLVYLMGAAMVDEQGRTTARKEGLFNLTGDALEQALEAESFSHASRFRWPLRVDAFIEPARVQIMNDHKPTFGDLLFIVRNNPFVPPGHEGIFLRGLHAGFHGDFLVASHLLTPQIENSLRYVLESHGVDVSNLMSDGTQPVKILGAMLGMPQTKQFLGEQLCFELRGCLIEKPGYDFRNRIAHGFVHETECYTAPSVTIWWLVLRICLVPTFQAIVKNRDTSASGSNQSKDPKSPEL